MSDFIVSTRLEKDGTALVDERVARFLSSLEKSEKTAAALALSSLTRSDLRRWRERVRELLGSDPLEVRGGHLVLSETGVRMLDEYRRRDSALRVHLASGFRVPLLAVDGVVVHRGKLVTIKRKYYPFKDQYCLPGGIVEYGETVEEAVQREVEEETGLKTEVASTVGVYSKPDRDPRGHIISIAFDLRVVGGELLSGSDASEVNLFDFESLPEMGFDHNTIVGDFLKRRRA